MAVAAYLMRVAGRFISSAVLLLVVTACASSAGHGPRTPPLPAPTPSGDGTDASYDWHGLITIPFGTLLKESPTPLHEVLLFHDEKPPAEVENKDCYAIEGTPPRFVGQKPETYLLCFDHDHLDRIEAGVRLAADEAPKVFARACALWLKNSAGSDAPLAPAGTLCEGRDGDVAFSARLGIMPGEPTGTVVIALANSAPRT